MTTSIIRALLTPPLLDEAAITAASAEELSATIDALLAEQHRRAVEGGDLDAITDEAFTQGFDSTGHARLPFQREGLLICPGAKHEKSASSHDCTFVAIGETWAWEHTDVVVDDMRTLPGAKIVRQTITIVPALEGLTYDVVTSTARGGGPCQMKKVRSFTITGGQLVETRTRARKSPDHP